MKNRRSRNRAGLGAAAFFVLFSGIFLHGSQMLVGATPTEHRLQPPITSVQLYSDQALIRRTASLTLEPGMQSLRIDDLPGSLNEDSVRVSFSGAGVKIEEIRVDTEYQKLYRSQEARQSEERLRNAENRLRLLSNRYVMLRDEEAAIRKIHVGAAPADPKAGRPLDPDRWKDTLNFMQSQLLKNQSETERLLEQIDGAREDLAVAIAVAERFRSGIAQSRKTVAVRFAFDGRQKERRDLTLEYRIGGASWFPVYQARVISKSAEESARVRLSVYALVRNETGEDWKNIRPVFSAADPAESSRLPVLSTWAIRSVLEESKKIDLYSKESRKPAPSPSQQRRDSPAVQVAQEEVAREQVVDDGEPDLKPKDEVVRQKLNIQTGKSQEYFQKNNEIVQDKRARNRTEQVEALLGEFRTNILNRDRSLSAGQYDRALEYSDSVIQNIRSLSPAHQGLFAEEEQKSLRIRRQALEMIDAKRFTSNLIPPVRSSRGFDYRYTSERSETIRSDGAFRRIFLFEKELPVSLLYESAPARARLAYLVGRARYADKVPLLSGPVSVFHNMDYTGEATLPTVSGGESFALHLGANEEVGIQRSERTFRKTEGLISRSYSNRTEVNITVRNQRRSTVQLDLLERIPVSADERVSVDVVSVEPSPLEKSERGIYRFRLTLKPGEIRKIRLVYDLTHGADVLPVMNETGVEN
ncbi:mucoidy inhibitor MuiA family protein [Leptonema illini]|uniref:DUF4139 domain-containing protein n=1 Tax=Leptonema illini DSM 21528 TaxID=929563 RepID=H2CLP8_9LEPT|nr:mucoidy inhibitor MuiA family protein [Leptonema illini]EHQ04659.1 Conserved hypothetical protein CHP02231 [Leptonema illini DSM 21528]